MKVQFAVTWQYFHSVFTGLQPGSSLHLFLRFGDGPFDGHTYQWGQLETELWERPLTILGSDLSIHSPWGVHSWYHAWSTQGNSNLGRQRHGVACSASRYLCMSPGRGHWEVCIILATLICYILAEWSHGLKKIVLKGGLSCLQCHMMINPGFFMIEALMIEDNDNLRSPVHYFFREHGFEAKLKSKCLSSWVPQESTFLSMNTTFNCPSMPVLGRWDECEPENDQSRSCARLSQSAWRYEETESGDSSSDQGSASG